MAGPGGAVGGPAKPWTRWLPFCDSAGRFSWLHSLTFAVLVAPVFLVVHFRATTVYLPNGATLLLYYTGVWATAGLLLSLAITPLRRLTGWGRLLSVRRMIGVSTIFYTLAHIVAYYFVRQGDWALIGWEYLNRITVSIATLSTVGIVALTATSTDGSIRRMGAARWRGLHRWVYVITALALAHFLLSRSSFGGRPFFMTGCFLWLMGWRLLAARGRGTDDISLVGLSVICGIATALLEGWLPWLLYGRYPPLETLAFNFSLELGLSAGWKVLGMGLILTAVTALAAWQRNGRRRRPGSIGPVSPRSP